MLPLIKVQSDDPRINGPQLLTTLPALKEEIEISRGRNVFVLRVDDQIYDVEAVISRTGEKRQQAVVTLVCTVLKVH